MGDLVRMLVLIGQVGSSCSWRCWCCGVGGWSLVQNRALSRCWSWSGGLRIRARYWFDMMLVGLSLYLLAGSE